MPYNFLDMYALKLANRCVLMLYLLLTGWFHATKSDANTHVNVCVEKESSWDIETDGIRSHVAADVLLSEVIKIFSMSLNPFYEK